MRAEVRRLQAMARKPRAKLFAADAFVSRLRFATACDPRIQRPGSEAKQRGDRQCFEEIGGHGGPPFADGAQSRQRLYLPDGVRDVFVSVAYRLDSAAFHRARIDREPTSPRA